MMTRRFILPCVLCLLAMAMLSAPAYGHKIMIFAYQEEDLVYTEGYFADGKKAQDSLVEVFDKDGSKLLEGKTDEDGAFSFPMPDEPEVRIVLTGSMGHRAECTVRGSSKTAGPGASHDPVPLSGGEDTGIDAAGAGVLGEERIRAIISEELDRKLSPLMREVALLNQDRPSVTDIIGGIGYIAGIMGILMYVKARRRNDT